MKLKKYLLIFFFLGHYYLILAQNPFNRYKGYYGRPFDSTVGVPPTIQLLAIAIILFIIIRVAIAIKMDKINSKSFNPNRKQKKFKKK